MPVQQTACKRLHAILKQAEPALSPRRTPTRVVVVTLLFLAGVIGLLSLRSPVESTHDRVFRSGTIRIGYAQEAPYAFLDDKGRVSGESPEIARAVWQRLGVDTIEWVLVDLGSLIPQLQAGRFDQIASGLFIRPDRERLVRFTVPTICPAPALLVRRGNPLGLHGYRDIAGKVSARLAVLDGAVEWEDARQAGVPEEHIHRYPHIDTALRALRTGLVDGFALSAPSIEKLAATNPDMQRALPFGDPGIQAGCGAFAFRLADSRLRDRFNRELAQYLGTQTHVALVQSLGFTPDCLPAPAQLDKETRP